jgi:hypothetical protein
VALATTTYTVGPKTEKIARAVVSALSHHSEFFEAADGLRTVRITARLSPTGVRVVTVESEVGHEVEG